MHSHLDSAKMLKQLKVLQYVRSALLIWVGGCIVTGILIWVVTLSKIDSDRQAAEETVRSAALAYSKAYAEQLDRMIAQIEHLTLNLQYEWIEDRGAVSLEDRYQFGLYPRSGKLYITLVDRNGRGVSTTLASMPQNAAEQAYFKYHQAYADSRLRVDDGVINGKYSGGPILRFTRRLDDSDGSFAGVVVVGVEPSYLATFSDENSLLNGDFISVRHANGSLLISEKGEDIRDAGQIHRQPPVFNAASGIRVDDGGKYKDNRPRIVAWQKNPRYPLVSYAGLSESSHLAHHYQTAADYRNFAIAASSGLFAIMLAGIGVGVRLGRRRHLSEEVRNTFRLATDAANEGFYMLRPVYDSSRHIVDFVFEDCNEQGAWLFGMTKASMLGDTLTTAIPNEQYCKEVLKVYRHAMQAGFHEDEWQVPEVSPLRADWVYRRLIRSGEGLAMTIRDISERKQQQRLLLDMANTDTLTGLPNRHWLMNYLPAAFKSADETATLVAVLFLDLDGFKDINDTYGHSAGDELLRSVASRLKALLRPEDCVVRLGGDEFTVVLPKVASQIEIAQIASRISHSFHTPFDVPNSRGMIGVSIGISVYPIDGREIGALLQKADISMYFAKEEGGGSFRFYDSQFHERVKHRVETEQELAQAIIRDEFVMYYQPRVDTMTGRLCSMEALVRWKHPVRGIVNPDEFIPLAERTGTIAPLGELIIEKVCSQLASWQAQGQPIVPVSVNISAQQFNAGNIHETVLSLLERYRLSPDWIEIELTESTMMNESNDIFEQVRLLHAMGIKLHVDDFGTGYSSLSRLQQFNMHMLKIDRAFTSQLGRSREGETLFKSIISMAKALNMKVVAEGVETIQQLRFLQILACDEVQGFLVSRPVPADAIVELMKKRYLYDESIVVL